MAEEFMQRREAIFFDPSEGDGEEFVELPSFAECERCKEWFPIEELVMMSAYGEEPEITCVRCLLYFLGEFLRNANLYDDDG